MENDMNAQDQNKTSKIVGALFLVYEGDIVRDENGKVTNRLIETMSYDIPKDYLEGIDLNSLNITDNATLINNFTNGV
jgi:hypothetical protein